MLGRLGIWRHLVVALSIVGCAILAFLGIIGSKGEHFDAKQITVSPAGGDAVRIREVVDQDFSFHSRHGYERIIPNDAGVPTDITASSPDANADVDVTDLGSSTRIRLGDPDETFRGQHRYILEYTLPDARVSTGVLDIDIIDAGEEFSTDRFDVIVTGFELENPTCNVGATGAEGGCTLDRVGDDYRVRFEPLAAGDGVNVGGTIVAVTTPTIPAEPPRPTNDRVKLGLLMFPLGLLAWGVVYVLARRAGRNEVFSGGAAEAAYGQLPKPGTPGGAPGVVTVSTHLVADAKLAELATIEFVPPKGIDPWHGSVLLTERLNDSTVSAWFSGLAASEAIMLRKDGHDLFVSVGPKLHELDQSNATIVNQFMRGRDELALGKYDASFAAAWSTVRQKQAAYIQASGWWKRHPPGAFSVAGAGVGKMFILAILLLVYLGGSVVTAASGLVQSIPAAIAFGLLVPAVTAYVVYATLLPARSATGSALTLLTESFRRFLAASEGRHVEWAWKQGVLREYSAWAVALGAADAWSRALSASNVPPAEYSAVNPLLIYSMGSAFSQSHVAPSSSGSGGGFSGGGFSGGGVGGGGGGGSSGSW